VSRWPEYRSACLFKRVIGDTCRVMSRGSGTFSLELSRTGEKVRVNVCLLGLRAECSYENLAVITRHLLVVC
jgi:hypothetical protein